MPTFVARGLFTEPALPASALILVLEPPEPSVDHAHDRLEREPVRVGSRVILKVSHVHQEALEILVLPTHGVPCVVYQD